MAFRAITTSITRLVSKHQTDRIARFDHKLELAKSIRVSRLSNVLRRALNTHRREYATMAIEFSIPYCSRVRGTIEHQIDVLDRYS